ncbi:hypothetical protein KL909_002358 [Ogataea angusta]|uniref:YMC020W-like alpha/beta hydrolase domain-containing protein n=1 Tax=Pichia angusta TaxID=870730 RepID=A0AAN6I783_PICAN|nr:uncharacterized protein KL928_002253 [Ogataea angusta]KAG7819579.1 hypothetical protein KL928_002253 [Ogataea angusta]KAG7824360.1 hypothetical protein KL909_002358 [Ogataea angusta]
MGKPESPQKSLVERSQSTNSISSLLKSRFKKNPQDDNKQQKSPHTDIVETPEQDGDIARTTEEQDLTLEQYRSQIKEQSTTSEEDLGHEQDGFLNRWGLWGQEQQSSWSSWIGPFKHHAETQPQNNAASNVTGREARGWWGWPWSAAANENSKDQVSVRTSENERVKAAIDQLSVLGPQIQRTTSWAYESHYGEKGGELSIFGTSTSNSPVHCESLPKTLYENQEASIDRLEESFCDVVPSLTYNYRDLTRRTKLRLFLSKICPIPLVPPETHLYHDPTFNEPLLDKNETKKALVISIHGFLPFKMTKSLIGQPTGSADIMTEKTTECLREWARNHGINIEIETISMDGSGRILERVNNCLFLLLDNWLDSILNCDYLFVSSHSQTVPVAIHIISRLITAGYLDNVEKAGLINISGVCLGPYKGLDSKLSVRAYTPFENNILMELFDFQDDETAQSKELVRHIEIILRKNVKLTFVGSIDDQFVPLYSSMCAHLNHPNIYRCVYLKDDTPAFLRQLVTLVMVVRNLNYDDHELLVEINSYLQGSLGAGSHGDIITNKNVYRVGIANTLETSNPVVQHRLNVKPINVKKFCFNQYHLPWCLRGFLQEALKLRNFPTRELLQNLFDAYRQWDPQSKQHKDLKYTIEVLGKSPIGELCMD